MRNYGCGRLGGKADRGIVISEMLNNRFTIMCSRWEFDDGEGNYFSWTVAGPNLEVGKYAQQDISSATDK